MSTIKLDHVSKIEGHADLHVKIEEGKVAHISLDGVEGARYFEGLLTGRKYSEVHEIVSRICGVCSQSHLLCALKSVENALGVELTEQAKTMRKLILYGSILQSHVLHLYFLALPDYLGAESVIELAPKYLNEVKTALSLKKLANDICTTFGGRDVHCNTPIVGGFSKLPTQEQVDALLERLKASRKGIMATFKLFASLPQPDFNRETEYMALKDPDEYAFYEGKLVSNKGVNLEQRDYLKVIKERVKDTSSAKFVSGSDGPYTVGSLSRLNNNVDQLHPVAKKALEKANVKFPSTNPFFNNVGQAIELVHITEETIEILENLKIKEEEPVEYKVKAGHGIAALEVPRGIVWHEYELDDEGNVVRGNIIAPTTQVLYNCEEDLKKFIPTQLGLPEDKLVIEIEKLIRSYDPCLSCAAHFLRLKLEK